MSITSPPTTTGDGHRSDAPTAATTRPTAADAVRRAPADAEPAAIASGVATQYWDEAVALPAGPSRLWLLVDGGWHALANPAPANRDLVQRAFLGTDSSVLVWYDGASIVGLVITGS